MLKLLGAGITIVSCSAAGFRICSVMKQRIRVLQELRRMTVMLSSEITYANATMEEAFFRIGKRLSAPVGTFLAHVRAGMEEGEHGLLCDIFRSQMEQDFAGSGLKRTDMESLETLGAQLGYLDTAMQKKTLDYYLEQVNDACAQAQQEYREKEKLFRCLGISAGVFLVILLY